MTYTPWNKELSAPHHVEPSAARTVVEVGAKSVATLVLIPLDILFSPFVLLTYVIVDAVIPG